MKIRFAKTEDIPVIVAMGKRMLDESRFARYGTNEAKLRAAIVAMIGTTDKACLFLAERSTGEIAGMLAGYVTDYFFCDAIVAQDRWFYVAPEHRGSSAAVKLLMTFRQWAQNRKADEFSINMSVGIDMGRFNKFMTHLGFGCCGSNFSMPLKARSSASASLPPTSLRSAGAAA